ncbi:hypothetical protein [Thiorhodococcus fuscus]|uniref:Helicase ATP-binding domain-containing protein n=1 Tax=Thiorhodococcus fuscus TaxID=527200 RepID=A0ABW4Y4T9_9GAMM
MNQETMTLYKQQPHVLPEVFAATMREHWETSLGNVPSPALQALWRTMAKAFNASINDEEHRWTVLQPPTGTGKTQGACLFSAMTAKKNEGLFMDERVGILIVTRLISQANEIVETVNRMAGFECAAAKHSESDLTAEEAQAFDVLVVTHAAYTNALEGLCKDDRSRWDALVRWEHGYRKLTIVDEAIANIVEEYNVKADDVRLTLAFITPDIRHRYPNEVAAVELVRDLLERIAEMHKDAEGDEDDTTSRFTESKVLWTPERKAQLLGSDASISLDNLRAAMKEVRYDLIGSRRESKDDRKRQAERFDKILRSIEAIMNRFMWYAKKGLEYSFNGSELLIPDDLPSPVVLDATARQNFLWTLLEDRAVILPVPPKTRNYRNVTLHVARARGTGKTAMKEKGKDRIPRLIHQLQQDLDPGRKVFVALHKDIEHHAVKYDPGFSEWSVGHWGAIDGRNDWMTYDTAVIFGLPYRDTIWATNAFFATQGVQSNEWLKNPEWKGYKDVREEMQIRQVCVSVVQAVNRVRCRKVTDADGSCDQSDVFIILPTGKMGEQMLKALVEEMPGIQVKGWDFELDGAKPRQRIKKGSSHEALLTLMQNALPGDYSVSHLNTELGLAPKGLEKIKAALRDPSHPLTRALLEVGVKVQHSGAKRGARTTLIKT